MDERGVRPALKVAGGEQVGQDLLAAKMNPAEPADGGGQQRLIVLELNVDRGGRHIERLRNAGAKTADLARKHGISEATLYNWKAKYGGMDVSEAKRLRQLEEENARLKKLLAEQMLDAAAMRELLSKKW